MSLTLPQVDVKSIFLLAFIRLRSCRVSSVFIFCTPMKDFGILLQVAGI